MTSAVEGEVIRGCKVVLREKRHSDAETDYAWRSDPELARFDAARPLSASFDDYRAPMRTRSPIRTPSATHWPSRTKGRYRQRDVLRHRPRSAEAELGITIGVLVLGPGLRTDAVRALLQHVQTMALRAGLP
jgi:RimJ/RimL family protein N-acetyltransferase